MTQVKTWTPVVLTDAEMMFGANIGNLMPRYNDIPQEFKDDWKPWPKLVSQWFFKGLDASKLVAKKGIDKKLALRHLKAVMGSWEPKHEHKTAGVAFLMSQWFEEVA